MALLKILQYPDERLHTVADQVPEVTNEVRALVHDMAETMYAAPALALRRLRSTCIVVLSSSIVPKRMTNCWC